MISPGDLPTIPSLVSVFPAGDEVVFRGGEALKEEFHAPETVMQQRHLGLTLGIRDGPKWRSAAATRETSS